MIPPFNLMKWIEENKNLLKPPVNNKTIYQDGTFIIMVVGGPNQRKDYHVNQTDEFFYQIQGDIVLETINKNGKRENIPIKMGEIFLLSGNIPHSPQRPAKSIGLVIEKQRGKNEHDGFQWYCEQCDHLLHEEFLHLENIVSQLPPLFQRFSESVEKRTCHQCGFFNA